jgi:hypothetical protein
MRHGGAGVAEGSLLEGGTPWPDAARGIFDVYTTTSEQDVYMY